jgi:ATP-dependent DNA helicase DinG
MNRPGAAAALDELQAALQELENILEPLGPRSTGMESCLIRTRKLSSLIMDLSGRSDERIRWIEKYSQGFALNSTPLDIAPIFRQMVDASPMGWVFTSATLAVNRSFDHFVQRLGLDVPETLILDSPFDYQRNALLYLPGGLPDPNDASYTRSVVDAALPLIRASGGGAFLLCTSYRALQEAAALLRSSLEVPLLVQGEMGRGELLQRFRDAGNAVLVGTSSFWEGVDVRGAALRLVIIDRLPFGSPGDPVLQARLEAMRGQGEDPFLSYQLPQAVISLKQGAGRLIRDAHDRGVLMLCDPRLRSRPYGKIFLRSLPDMPQTRELADACRFFEAEVAAT